jgi:hypothetical protein
MRPGSPVVVAKPTKLPLRLRKGRLSVEAEQAVSILVTEYRMQRDDAIRLVAEAGPMLVLALRARKKV